MESGVPPGGKNLPPAGAQAIATGDAELQLVRMALVDQHTRVDIGPRYQEGGIGRDLPEVDGSRRVEDLRSGKEAAQPARLGRFRIAGGKRRY